MSKAVGERQAWRRGQNPPGLCSHAVTSQQTTLVVLAFIDVNVGEIQIPNMLAAQRQSERGTMIVAGARTHH